MSPPTSSLSLYDRLTHRCCHACSQCLKVDDGVFHTNVQILTCASICDVCSALAEFVLAKEQPRKLPYCEGDYIFLNKHDGDWEMVEEKAGGWCDIPRESWRYVKSCDNGGICVKRVSFPILP